MTVRDGGEVYQLTPRGQSTLETGRQTWRSFAHGMNAILFGPRDGRDWIMSESLEAYLRKSTRRSLLGPGTQHNGGASFGEIEEHILEGCEAEQSGERHRRTRSNARWQGWGLLAPLLMDFIPWSTGSAYAAGVWARGALLGVGLGLVWLASVLWRADSDGRFRTFATVALVIVPLAAGALGASETGRFGSGALAGFWCGVAAAVFIAVSTVAIDVVFVSHFMQTSWLTAPVAISIAAILAACEIGDDLGFAASTAVGLPLIMAGLGAVGGAIGLALHPQQGKTCNRVQPQQLGHERP